MEPLTVAGTGMALLASKEVLGKLLGPTADYIGQRAKGLVEKCDINLDNIFKKAIKRAGKKIDEPRSVSPRVLKEVVNEGAFCDEPLAAEYFGGLLAAARSKADYDDRAVPLLDVVSRLSVYQIRLHYLGYTLFKRLCDGKPINLSVPSQWKGLAVFVPDTAYSLSVQVPEDENAVSIVTQALCGLSRHDLVGPDHIAGSAAFIGQMYSFCGSGGFVFQPTVFGMELFLWAHGSSEVPSSRFLTDAFHLDETPQIPIPDGACQVALRQERRLTDDEILKKIKESGLLGP